MDSTTWGRVRSIFAEVVGLAEPLRSRRLQELCGQDEEVLEEVLSLLRFDQDSDTVLEGPIAESAAEYLGGRLSPGTALSNYKVEDLLGRGGMGDVYAATQTGPIQREVALKIIRPGMGSSQVVARFEAERQTLARMNHPYIAKVFDAGTTPDGRPFFAMERVRGVPITEYCANEMLDSRSRLELFLSVCEAVQHAHQKGVIHRDLKPSNLLVSVEDGGPVPKVIDFGIAKALTPDPVLETAGATPVTQFGQVMGTPDYMSPEQADLEESAVDTRTDVYSLGVILFELLVGEVPIRTRSETGATPLERARRLREVEPPRPSHRLRELAEGTGSTTASLSSSETVDDLYGLYRRDLDWIVLKALAKEQDRRYGSPAEFAADLERFLHDEPVLARPPSRTYRVQKFVRRHRVGVVAAAGALAAVISGAVAASVGFVQARQAEAEALRLAAVAQQESRTAEQVSDFLLNLFDAADPFGGIGPGTPVRELIDKGAGDLRSGLQEEPATRGRLLVRIAEVYESLGLLDEALENARKAAAIYEEHGTEGLGGDHAVALTVLSDMIIENNPTPEALEVAERAVSIARDADSRKALAAALRQLGSAHVELGAMEESLSAFDEAITVAEAVGDESATVAIVYASVQPLLIMEDLLEAERRLDRVIAFHSARGEASEMRLANVLGAYGEVVLRLQRPEEAEAAFRQALELFTEVLGADHVMTLRARGSLAALLLRGGETATARDLLEQTRRVAERDHGDNLLLNANINNDLGKAHEDLGDLDQARRHYEIAVSLGIDAFGEQHPFVAFAYNNLGIVARKQGRLEESQRIQLKSLEIKKATLSPSHPSVLSSLQALGQVAFDQGDLEKAEEYLREGLALADAMTPVPRHRERLAINLADVLEETGRELEAAELRASLQESQRPQE